MKEYIDKSSLLNYNYATKTEMNDLFATAEANEPYLPLSGGTITGNLNIVGNGAITVGDETTTNYGGIQSVRACSGDEDNVNTAGYFINVDGRSKFLHRRGPYNEKEDAYLLFDGTGYSFYCGGDKGIHVTETGSSGEGITPILSVLANDDYLKFKGKELAFKEDVDKIKVALLTLGIEV